MTIPDQRRTVLRGGLADKVARECAICSLLEDYFHPHFLTRTLLAQNALKPERCVIKVKGFTTQLALMVDRQQLSKASTQNRLNCLTCGVPLVPPWIGESQL
jgi:hypothetical protein